MWFTQISSSDTTYVLTPTLPVFFDFRLSNISLVICSISSAVGSSSSSSSPPSSSSSLPSPPERDRPYYLFIPVPLLATTIWETNLFHLRKFRRLGQLLLPTPRTGWKWYPIKQQASAYSCKYTEMLLIDMTKLLVPYSCPRFQWWGGTEWSRRGGLRRPGPSHLPSLWTSSRTNFSPAIDGGVENNERIKIWCVMGEVWITDPFKALYSSLTVSSSISSSSSSPSVSTSSSSSSSTTCLFDRFFNTSAVISSPSSSSSEKAFKQSNNPPQKNSQIQAVLVLYTNRYKRLTFHVGVVLDQGVCI